MAAPRRGSPWGARPREVVGQCAQSWRRRARRPFGARPEEATVRHSAGLGGAQRGRRGARDRGWSTPCLTARVHKEAERRVLSFVLAAELGAEHRRARGRGRAPPCRTRGRVPPCSGRPPPYCSTAAKFGAGAVLAAASGPPAVVLPLGPLPHPRDASCSTPER